MASAAHGNNEMQARDNIKIVTSLTAVEKKGTRGRSRLTREDGYRKQASGKPTKRDLHGEHEDRMRRFEYETVSLGRMNSVLQGHGELWFNVKGTPSVLELTGQVQGLGHVEVRILYYVSESKASPDAEYVSAKSVRCSWLKHRCFKVVKRGTSEMTIKWLSFKNKGINRNKKQRLRAEDKFQMRSGFDAGVVQRHGSRPR
ncbi:hypothetical protein BKA66DRAFT_447632 [Pyrenochaeta sp. MPI-SDFR-AT-0127]|nr:hypothetical protein BKA66DRAFT_447632 [Pyrenochaeta sp. MPI-SDFR-AT-0127]